MKAKVVGAWALAVVIIVGVVYLSQREPDREFQAFDMAGGPLVITDSAGAHVVTLTSHRESRFVRVSDDVSANVSKLHWDLWDFSLADFSRRWVTRLASIERAALNTDATILGADQGVIWLVADYLLAVSLRDGSVIADATAIEARNAQLRGLMPRDTRQLQFRDGLVVVAADGKRWRVDSRTLMATPDSRELEATPRAATARPIRLLSQYQHYKTRSYVVDGHWYGLMHPDEAAKVQREMIGQDFRAPHEYTLWSAAMHDTVDRFGNSGRALGPLAPLPNGNEFLQGGLLSVPDTSGYERVIGIANPTRLLVLHQTRIDDYGTQLLSCVTLAGRSCWTAPLEMSLATAFVPLTSGGPSEWALFVTGFERRHPESNSSEATVTEFPVLARVRIADGAVQRMSFADVDLAKLSDELKPYRAWKQ